MRAAMMMRPLTSLWLLAAVLMEWTCFQASADDSILCDTAPNEDLCWWNNLSKRYLRFGRSNGLPVQRFGRGYGDPILRFGRGYGDPILRFGRSSYPSDVTKRSETDAEKGEYYENNGYLRFGRSLPEAAMMVGLLERKRRAVNGAPSLTKRAAPGSESAFVRWGRVPGKHSLADEADVEQGVDDIDRLEEEKRYLRFGRGDAHKRYLRFGRAQQEGFLRFGKSA